MKKIIYILALLAFTACSSSTTLNVMSFNMRYDNPDDSLNNWQFRRDRVAQLIESQNIDIFGAQELLSNQMGDLKSLLPNYDFVGVGRQDGIEMGEFAPIFYLRDRFTLLDSGNFWLSESPEVAGSKGWDGACERIATWAILRDASGVEMLFINTHLDHVGLVARTEGVRLLEERIEALRGERSVVLTGDFNATPDSFVIANVLASGELLDSRSQALEVGGEAWSFSNFGRIAPSERTLIDYIFVSGKIVVNSYKTLGDSYKGGYLSDHAPVMATITLKN